MENLMGPRLEPVADEHFRVPAEAWMNGKVMNVTESKTGSGYLVRDSSQQRLLHLVEEPSQLNTLQNAGPWNAHLLSIDTQLSQTHIHDWLRSKGGLGTEEVTHLIDRRELKALCPQLQK